MVDMELLQAIEQMLDKKLDEKLDKMLDEKLDKKLDEKLAPVVQRLDALEEDIAEVKESLSEVRTGVNTLLDWADEVGGTIAFPNPKMNL